MLRTWSSVGRETCRPRDPRKQVAPSAHAMEQVYSVTRWIFLPSVSLPRAVSSLEAERSAAKRTTRRADVGGNVRMGTRAGRSRPMRSRPVNRKATMDLSEYQRIAAQTDQRPAEPDPQDDDAVVIPLLGLVGEVGTLQAQYKKYLRDGDAYRLFPRHMSEELGDILWYVANLATKFDLSLSDIARDNLAKTADRWPSSPRPSTRLLDDKSPRDEQLPRDFRIEFGPVIAPTRPETMVQATWQGEPFGDPLGDNAYQEDWYRYHDAMPCRGGRY